MRAVLEHATGLGDVVHRARELSARTLIFDIEPLVAYWDGGREALDQGIARVFSEVSALPALQVLCFATNSPRRPAVVPSRSGMQVVYLASAGKPLRTSAYRRFPRPGVVIGDQVATDGILAPGLYLHPVRPAADGYARWTTADGRLGPAGTAAAVHAR